jgi:hypothetical protein
VDAAIPDLRAELEQSLQSRVKRASRPFNHLASHLHSKLDDTIRNTDVRNARKANQIQVARTQVLQAWLEAPGGPATVWEDQLTQFQQDILGWVRKHLSDNESVSRLRGTSFDIGTLDLSLTQAKRGARQDIVQRAAVVVGIAAPIAATATWIGGALAATAIFPPAAAIAGAAALLFVGVQLFKTKVTSLEVTQREWIAALDSHAQTVQEQFELSLAAQSILMIDNLADNVESYRTQLEESMERIHDRIADPRIQTHQELVDQLEPLSKEGEQITAVLRELSSFEPESRH